MSHAKKAFGAGLVGSLLGITAGAATVYLSDKKNRQKLLKKAKEFEAIARKKASELDKKAKEMQKKADEAADIVDKVQKQAKEDAKELEKTAN